MPDEMKPPRVGVQRLAKGGRGFDYDPLPDDAVIRFRVDAKNTIDVRMEGGELVLHHDGDEGSRARMVVVPVVANVLAVAIHRKGR